VLTAAKRVVLIAGPTASGKSALALRMAGETDGVIVNADAMQVYDGLRVLTARPSDEDLAAAPHRLYGFVPPATRFSTGDWTRAVAALIRKVRDEPLIFVGGTGLYFEALTNGFADVPVVPDEIAVAAMEEVEGLDRAQRAALIAARDPEMAARLNEPDPQRVIRALAVKRATGQSLASFQDRPQKPLLDGWSLIRIVLDPEREQVRRRIAERFEAMIEGAAVDEVRALLSLELDPGLPAMKAIGVREIGDLLAGKISREQAVERAVTATRQYAKRQRTWFRNRMADWRWLS
jgi:tRNA dimethylallyltransferase